MALSKKERYRLNLDALYGTDMSQYRLIDEIHHKKRRNILTVIIAVLTAITLVGIIFMISLSANEKQFAIGTKIDGSSFVGIISKEEIRKELSKQSLEELTYDNLQVFIPATEGNALIIFVYLVLLIILLDKRAESTRALKAKAEFDRQNAILEKEAAQKKADFVNESHRNAPDIIIDEEHESDCTDISSTGNVNDNN